MNFFTVVCLLSIFAPVAHAEGMVIPGKVFRDCLDCPEMVEIPAGSFDMGSFLGLGEEEKPLRKFAIKQAFALGKTEVTQGQWRAIMGNTPGKFSNCGDTCPVGSASWDDAQEFIRRLNLLTGKQYRLPTEVEWEYAFHLSPMSNTVFEWVDGSARVTNGDRREIRGGTWLNSPQLLRAAIHGGYEPALRINKLGFRLARMLP